MQNKTQKKIIDGLHTDFGTLNQNEQKCNQHVAIVELHMYGPCY